MTDPDFTLQQRRRAIVESIVEMRSQEAEQRIIQFLERSSGSANDWDHRFLEFVRSPDSGRLFHASAGDGIEVLFSPSTGKGLWLMDQPLLRGKGFLSPHDVERLASLTAEAGPRQG